MDSGFNLRSLLQQAGDVPVSSMSVSGFNLSIASVYGTDLDLQRFSSRMPKKSNATRWREMAERSRARADRMRDPQAKRTMLDIARAYEALTRRADTISSPDPQPSEPDENETN